MRAVLAVVALLVAAFLAGAGAASAHSVVLSSTPENESSIDAGPATASVTFNEAIQEQFAALTVVGPDGNLWSRSDPSVDGATVSVDLGDLGPVGTYTIAYRVTSADGHPVTGTRTFELTAEGNGTPGPPADGSAPPAPATGSANGGSTDAASTETANAADTADDGLPLWPFLVAAGVVFAGGLAFTLRTRN